ncbi:hypothetical protein ACPPVO_22155 [Dactylosporangium sp. McL0621]|uniref:hypothetical protein n=1 Tax=Dactylosporangium sp. McL0621 TaxID=3415678 RepID=UPI003CF225F5
MTTTRLTFDLDTVCQLAEHAAAVTDTNHTGTAHPGPALLLRSGSNGIWLVSNAAHRQPAPAHQAGTLDRRAAFAAECPPGSSWLDQATLLRVEPIPLTHELPLDSPADHPLLDQLRAASRAGATTVTVLLSGTGVAVAVGRRRVRPAAGRTPPADRGDRTATATPVGRQHPDWHDLRRGYRPLPQYSRISELMTRVESLRAANARLHNADLTLVGFGVLAHRDEYLARTAAIRDEARTISDELQSLGAYEAAELARSDWTMTLSRHRAATPATGQ